MQFSIQTFDPESTPQELWEKYFDLYEDIRREIYPDDPIPSRNMIKKSLLLPDPNLHHYRWVTFDNKSKKLIGYAMLNFHRKSSPEYEANKVQAFSDIIVQREYRRKGIGTDLLELVIRKAKEEKKKIFQSWGIPEASTSFFEAFGCKRASKEQENRLKLSEIDWNMITTWREEGSVKAKDVTLERFETVPEEDIEEYCRFFTEVVNQIPKEELEWEANVTPEVRRKFERRNQKLDIIWTTFISREGDSTISGLTETFYHPDRKTIIFQGLTGVGITYRGRGLGKWLKAEMVAYIKDAFPSVTTVATDFALVNKPMIAINRRLGFKPYKIWIGYKKEVDLLLQKIIEKKKIST
jgi:GNAT superfamily N-acetyltransferase